jgi:hypothetical protein
MNRVLIFFTILFLTSCSLSRFEVLEDAKKIASDRGMIVRTYHVKNFNIFALERITDPKKPLRIYIEGDGRAYINKYQPSLDPTPRTNFLINLVAQDNSPNLLYIARPCQYLDSEKCEEKYWTSERFSTEAISAISEVVDAFAKYDLEIVGYSGGAMMALHLPQKNIKNIRTIAGNLDLEKFTEIHHISKLQTPEIDYKRLAEIPQIHFVGSLDKIIPLTIFTAYQQKLPRKNCVKMKIIEGATHNKNWQESWEALVKVSPACI